GRPFPPSMRGPAPAQEGSLRGSLIIRAAWSNSHVAFHCAPADPSAPQAGKSSGRNTRPKPAPFFCSRLVSLYAPVAPLAAMEPAFNGVEPVWLALRLYSAALATARDKSARVSHALDLPHDYALVAEHFGSGCTPVAVPRACQGLQDAGGPRSD